MADLNVLPLGSYDVLIGMDWLEKHWSLVNCKQRLFIIGMNLELGKRCKELSGQCRFSQ